MSKTTALHVHHAFQYNSLTSTARLRRETSQCDVLWGTWIYYDKFSLLYLNMDKALKTSTQGKVAYILRIRRFQIDAIKFEKTQIRQTTSSPPFFLRGSRASETRARVKITPREKRRHAAEREKNEELQTKPKLLNLCVALTTQNSDWLFHGNLSTSVKNAPAAINTRRNHNLQNK